MSKLSQPYPLVQLGKVVQPVNRGEEVKSGTLYRQIGVRLWGQGAYERETIDGRETQYKTLNRVETDDIIVNKIWARNGSVAVVSTDLAGCYGSGEFPTFSPDTKQLCPRWFHWITKTKFFWQACDEKSRGTSGKNRIRPDKFLEIEIPLPPLDEQQRIVARIEALAGRVAEAQRLRAEALAQVERMVASESYRLFTRLFTEDEVTTIGQVVTFRGDLLRPTDGKTGLQRFVGLQHVESHIGEKIGEDWVLAEDLQGRKFRFSAGEIVYGYLRPYLNKVWIADGEGLCSVDQYILRPAPTLIDTHYLAYFMRSPHFLQRANELTHNLMLPRLRSGLLESIEIPLPSLAKQQEVVLLLDKLHAKGQMLKNLQSATQAELDALLPAILDKAFRGELL